MRFSRGATAFIIESGKAVRMVTVLESQSDRCIICVEGTDERRAVSADSLFYSEIQAQNTLRRTMPANPVFDWNRLHTEMMKL